MHTGLRKAMMASLLACFVGQTVLVYTDETADRTPPLSELALEGRHIWHDYNCQACHQLYGFGGFLGPDLTNAGPRLAASDHLTKVLTEGPNEGISQMPAFWMNEDQIAALEQFFIELNETGVGVPHAFKQPDPAVIFEAISAHATETNAPADVMTGLAMFKPICGHCHTPFSATPLGLHTAPDLSTVTDRLDDAGILETITKGRMERGMPPQPPNITALGPQFLALLHWLKKERAAIVARFGGSTDELSLPWWEYK